MMYRRHYTQISPCGKCGHGILCLVRDGGYASPITKNELAINGFDDMHEALDEVANGLNYLLGERVDPNIALHEPIGSDLLNKAKGHATSAKEKAKDAAHTAKTSASHAADKAKAKVGEIKDSEHAKKAVAGLKDAGNKAKDKANEAKDKVSATAKEQKDKAKGVLNKLGGQPRYVFY